MAEQAGRVLVEGKGYQKVQDASQGKRRTAMQGTGGSDNETVFTEAPQEVTEEDVAHIFRESIQNC